MERTRTDDDYYELMRAEQSRLNTFHDYPDDAAIRPTSLAAAGFFYTGRGTRVECAFCSSSIKEWTRTDDPVTVHRNRFPHCQFIQQRPTSSRSEDTGPPDLTQPASPSYRRSQSSDNDPKCFRDCLIQSRDIIVQNLKHADDIVEHLAEDSISAISQDQCEVILLERGEHQKVRKLLDTLHKCGEEAIRKFLVALHFSEQRELCQTPSGLQLDLPTEPLDILSCDKFKTLLMKKYKADIEERNRLEREQYGNVVTLDQHEPVVITHGKKCPDEHLRKGFREFIINQSDKQVVSLREIFEPSFHQKRDHTILLLGGPGSGKTSLCYTILNHYIQKQWLNEHSIVFSMSLKTLEGLPELTLSELLFSYGGVNIEGKIESVMKQLEMRQRSVLLMFDGYDEVEQFLKPNLVKITNHNTKATPLTIVANVIQGNLLPESQVLVTSRSYDMHHLKTDSVCELAGLKQESIESLIKQVIPPHIFTKMSNYLTENSDVCSLLAMPVNLQKYLSYIMWLAEDDNDDEAEHLSSLFPQTKSAVYSSQIYPIIKQCLRLEGIANLGREKMWREPFVKQHLLRLCNLASLALKKLGERQILFSENDLKSCDLSDQVVKVCGFMTSFIQKKLTRDGVVSIILYIFTHLTNLEWVGGLHVIGSPKKFAEIVSSNRGQFDVLLCFAVGLLRQSDGQQMIECIYDMSKDDCKSMAEQMFSNVISSKRCENQNGAQFCLELFFEGQFDDPMLMVHRLSPQPQMVEIAGISLVNKAAVRYFFSKLISWYREHTETATEINHLRLGFSKGADFPVIRDIIADAITLQKLRLIEFLDAGILQEFSSTFLTTATFVVHYDAEADILRDIFSGVCSIESCRSLKIHKTTERATTRQNHSSESRKIALCTKPAIKGESRATAGLNLFHTEDRDIVGAALGCLTCMDHIKHIEVNVGESPVTLLVERGDFLPIIYHVTITDTASDSLSDGCLRGLVSKDCLVLKRADDASVKTVDDSHTPIAMLYIHITDDNIHSLSCNNRQQTDDKAASAVPSQTGDVSRRMQGRHAHDADKAIAAAGIIHYTMSHHLASRSSILVDMDELPTNEVGQKIAELSQIIPLDMVFLKGEMSDETVEQVLSEAIARSSCFVDTSGLYRPRLPPTTKTALIEIHVIPECHLPDDWSTPSTLSALSSLWYDDDKAEQVHRVIRQSSSLVALGVFVVALRDTTGLMEALAELPRLNCLMLSVGYPHHHDLVNGVLRLISLTQLWLKFWSSPSDNNLRELSHLVSLSHNLHTISLLNCNNITPFVENLTAPHLKKIYIARDTMVDVRSLVGFTGQIVSVEHDYPSLHLCPLINNQLLTNVDPLAKQILKARFVKPCQLYPIT